MNWWKKSKCSICTICGDGNRLAALDGQTHDGKDLLHIGSFAVFRHGGFALKALGGFAQDPGGAGVQTFLVLNGDVDALYNGLSFYKITVSVPVHSSDRWFF